MGAISSTAKNLSAEDKAFIADNLKKVYENSKASGKADAEIQLLCAEEFNKIFVNGKVVYPNKSIPAKVVRGKNAGILGSRSRIGVSHNADMLDAKPTTKEKRSRRRSFDPAANISDKEVKEEEKARNAAIALLSSNGPSGLPLSPIATSKSTHALSGAADSWDSVSTQPFCDTCNMAFKTVALQQKHVKYSKVHAQNLEHARAKEITPLAPIVNSSPSKTLAKIEEPKEEPNSTAVVVRQEEGTHFRLLYSGTKFFWRTQNSVDFDIYHHFLASTIEIIPYNATKSFEMDRLYLKYEEAVRMVTPLVDEEILKRLDEISKDRFAEKPDESKLREEVLVQKLVIFMLQRLNLESSGSKAGECIFMTLYGDSYETPLALSLPPVVLLPISVARRRRTTTEEIDAAFQNMIKDKNMMAKDLASASTSLLQVNQNLQRRTSTVVQASYAVKVANIVYDAANYLMKIEKCTKENRWQWAIRRVISRIRIRRYRDYFIERGIQCGKKEITFKVPSHIVPSDRFHSHGGHRHTDVVLTYAITGETHHQALAPVQDKEKEVE